MYFISENFYFNDISNKTYGVELVTVDNDSIINQFGMTYSEVLEKQDSPQLNPLFKNSGEKEAEEITLCFALVNLNGEPIEWDSNKIEEVYDWLITDDFVPFVSEDDEDKVYYFKTVEIKKQFTHDMKGYLEVKFKPYSSYSYTRVVATGSTRVVINNMSNVDSVYKPVIEITGTGGDVSITNTSIPNSEPFTVTALNEKVTVDSLYRTVQTDNGKNMLSKTNRKWIELKRGLNALEIVGGSIKVICEFPTAI